MGKFSQLLGYEWQIAPSEIPEDCVTIKTTQGVELILIRKEKHWSDAECGIRNIPQKLSELGTYTCN